MTLMSGKVVSRNVSAPLMVSAKWHCLWIKVELVQGSRAARKTCLWAAEASGCGLLFGPCLCACVRMWKWKCMQLYSYMFLGMRRYY